MKAYSVGKNKIRIRLLANSSRERYHYSNYREFFTIYYAHFEKQRDELANMEYERIYLTPEGIERLHEKLLYLKRVLPDRAAEAKRTADFGDRSENFEYKQAKSLLRSTHRQILAIEDQLKRVSIISSVANPNGKIQLGSTVVVELSDGNKKTFQVVGPAETNPERGRISHESPLGKALIGRAKNEIILIATPRGKEEYRIVEIR